MQCRNLQDAINVFQYEITYLASEPSRQASRPPQNTPENENSRTEYLNNHILEFAKNKALELQLHKKEDYRISKL